MPATVSVTLIKSHWPIKLNMVGWLLFCLVLYQIVGLESFLLMPLGLLVPKLFGNKALTDLRWQTSTLTLISDLDTKEVSWTGRGRRSALFIQWQVIGEQGKDTLVIWKDQVSDSSWRALNMAFSVWQSPVLQSAV